MSLLRKVLTNISLYADRHESIKKSRSGLALLARFVRLSNDKAADNVQSLVDYIEKREEISSVWLSPDAVFDQTKGHFNACDLRHWLKIAEKSGVEFIPAREIASLSEDEISLLSGKVDLPKDRHVSKILSSFGKKMIEIIGEENIPERQPVELDLEEIQEKLTSAMDDVPEKWMVRSHLCGSTRLKAWAGAGAAASQDPVARFDQNVEVGPGWVRLGNRRSIEATDQRTLDQYIAAPTGPCVFLARPWILSSRWIECEDPERHGTQFAGKGLWPSEWRVFVERGKVVGISFYYPWCGTASPENAHMALVVKAEAEKMIEWMKIHEIFPAFLETEMLRGSNYEKMDERISSALKDKFPYDDIAMTLDFLETDHGPVLLEGGPAHTPWGGAHPCGFAGTSGKPLQGNMMKIDGVAFSMMNGILLSQPGTWARTNYDECILSWPDVEKLAEEYELTKSGPSSFLT